MSPQLHTIRQKPATLPDSCPLKHSNHQYHQLFLGCRIGPTSTRRPDSVHPSKIDTSNTSTIQKLTASLRSCRSKYSSLHLCLHFPRTTSSQTEKVGEFGHQLLLCIIGSLVLRYWHSHIHSRPTCNLEAQTPPSLSNYCSKCPALHLHPMIYILHSC